MTMEKATRGVENLKGLKNSTQWVENLLKLFLINN